MRLHHVGYLTKRLRETQEEFLALGFLVEQEEENDPLRKIHISFLRNGSCRVELVEPDGADSPLFPLLKKYKNTPYHFCYETENMGEMLRSLEGRGYRVIQEPLAAPCIRGGCVAFLIHPSVGMIELLEWKKGKRRVGPA